MTPSADCPNTLHVVRRGAGLPVVAVHGYGVDHRILMALDPALEKVGRLERYYLDLPGFGQSAALPEPGGLQDVADALLAHLRADLGTRPFALLANSLGGLLARYVRSRLGEQVVGMAFVAPAVFTDTGARTLPELGVVERDDALLESLPEEDREKFTELACRQNRPGWELFREFALPGMQTADPAAMKNLNSRYALDAGEPDEESGPFTGPTLMLTGRQDHVVGYEDQFELVTRWYPNATYAALDGAGHNAHLDCPEASRDLVHRWAEELPGR